MNDRGLGPADAKKILYKVLGAGGIGIVPAFAAQDLANVRRAYPNDDDFAFASVAIAKEIRAALASPATHGVPVEHDLSGWRRSKFGSREGLAANLRLVFRESKGGMEILAFGDREFPESVYYTAKDRLYP